MNQTIIYNLLFTRLVEPDPIAYSFNAPGWYIVLAGLFLIALVSGFIQYRRFKKNAYRRNAIEQLEAIVQQKSNVVYAINALLKLIAIQLYGRRKVASLYGKAWFSFLNSTMAPEKRIAEKEFEKLTTVLYNPREKPGENSINKLVDFALVWIKNHRANV